MAAPRKLVDAVARAFVKAQFRWIAFEHSSTPLNDKVLEDSVAKIWNGKSPMDLRSQQSARFVAEAVLADPDVLAELKLRLEDESPLITVPVHLSFNKGDGA